MPKLGLFTAVSFGDQPKTAYESMLEFVSDYFYFYGRKARIIKINDNEVKAFLINESPSFFSTCIKISYITGIIPVLMLVANAILRSMRSYELDDKPISHFVIDTLNLNLEETATIDPNNPMFAEDVKPHLPNQAFIMRNAVKEVIDKLNDLKEQNSKNKSCASEKEKSKVHFNIESPWHKGDSNFYFYDQFCGITHQDIFINDKEASNLWLKRIFAALAEKKYIKILKEQSFVYLIQV